MDEFDLIGETEENEGIFINGIAYLHSIDKLDNDELIIKLYDLSKKSKIYFTYEGDILKIKKDIKFFDFHDNLDDIITHLNNLFNKKYVEAKENNGEYSLQLIDIISGIKKSGNIKLVKKNVNNKSSNQSEKTSEKQGLINIIEVFEKFLENISGDNIIELYKKIRKYIHFLYCYADKIMKRYINNYNIKAYLKVRRNLLYIIKLFIKSKIGEYKYKHSTIYNIHTEKVFIFMLFFLFHIFIRVIECKSKINKEEKENNNKLKLLNELLSKFMYTVGNFYSTYIFKEEHLETFFKFLIILSTTISNVKPSNKNDNINNLMFLVQCIKAMKIIFNKIYSTQKEFNEKNEQLMNNIIIFLKTYLIEYNDQKPMNVINKFFLSNNDYYTTSLLGLSGIISKMKNEQIKCNFIELITNIYSFSFRNDNMMNQLLKLIEPLLLNLDKKSINEIDSEINLIHLILSFMKELSKKEIQIFDKEPLLKEGFFLGNKICGISSEIDVLEDEFSLIFGFCLSEKYNPNNVIKEWSLINIKSKKNNKDKIKIWLSKKNNSSDQYNLMISDKNQIHNTDIIIKSKSSYIFSFNFVKNKKVKISYICENEQEIKKIKDINLKFNIDNTHIYIGCDVIKKNWIDDEEQQNTFFGYIGTIIILNNKKLSKKGDENIDLILQLKGDYANCILLSLLISNDINFINNEEKYLFRNSDNNKNILNRLKEIYIYSKIKFLDVIKTVISPKSFKLVEYHDEIDYLKIYNDYKIYEESKYNDFIEVKQNYLNLEQIKEKYDKMIKINSKFFNSRFNVFENKYSLEEFIKYDGIFYLCLLLEYNYQTLCNIEKKHQCNKYILEKIENNIIEIIEFFNDYIINKHYLNNFYNDIEKFFYQMTTTIKQYININNINDKIFNMISQLIDKITDIIKGNIDVSEEDLENKIFKLKSKLFGLLHDILSLFYQDSKLSCYVINKYISIFSNLLIKGELNDLFSKELIDEFLFISFIFENGLSVLKNEKDKIYTQMLYEDLLIKLLKNSMILSQSKSNKNSSKIEIQKKSFFNIFKKTNNSDGKTKEEKVEINNEYFDHYLELTFQRVNYPNIFSRLLDIVYKSNMVSEIKPIYIEHIKFLLHNYYYETRKYKNDLFNSCLKIILIYYILNNQYETIHNFIKRLEFYEDFFYSLFTAMNYIKFIDNGIENNNILDNNEKSINEIYPLLHLDLNNLNERQNKTLITLFQDCISMLFVEDFITKQIIIRDKINSNIAKKIYECMKVNINEAFKFQGKKVYKDIFSSESNITSKLFFFKLKLSNKEEKNEILKDLKFYHEKLLKNHSFPFVFDFISLIINDENFDENDNRKIDFILDILDFILNEFEKCYNKSSKKVKEKDIYLIINIINYVVSIHNIFFNEDYREVFVDNFRFKEIFFRLSNVLNITGLLFSNYCFSIDEKRGKIICEICYDIFLSLLDKNFTDENKQKFINLFFIYDKSKKTFINVFYLMDLNREEILKREKNVRKDILIRYIDGYSNLKFIHENFFNSNILVYGRNIKKIEGVNFSIYFLAKTFLYWKELKREELKKMLNKNILPILSKYIYFIWLEYNAFYGRKLCSKFPLYEITKDFFENHAILESNHFELLKEFFIKDIPYKLNGQDKIYYCYASRLLNQYEINYIKKTIKEEPEEIIKDTLFIIPNNSLIPLGKDKCFLTFDKITNSNVIINPKNYLMKIIFSNNFKKVFFKDKIFQKIKYSYICINKENIGLNIRTKQLEYPSKEKNFSNFLEPKSFLRRDYNFYKNDFFPVSHKYIPQYLINERDDNKLFFYEHSFERDLIYEEIFDCELITNQLLYFGKFNIHKDYIYFKSEIDPRDKNPKINQDILSKYIFSRREKDNMTKKNKHILMNVKEIKEIIKKRTLLMNNSLEIFNKNGKSFFFNFFSTRILENICEMLKNKCKINIEQDKENIKNIISLYKKGEISNYEYLLYLNKLSTRTFNDWTQYPVFPWIITDISKFFKYDKINLLKNDIRDMNYPLSMQSSIKRVVEINKFFESAKYSKFPSHFGSHYSTSKLIFYYLTRNNPAYQNIIKMLNYNQENPDRLFTSFTETQKLIKSNDDNRELIPDFFCFIEHFCNINCIYFGETTNSILVDDFNILGQYDKDDEKCTNLISQFVKYLYLHKNILNDIETSKKLYQWVDIIFGKKQYPKKKEERAKSCNIFGKYTYEKNINLEKKLDKYIKQFIKDKTLEEKLIKKINTKINIINNFGICPRQILTESVIYQDNPQIHPKKIQIDLFSDSYFYFTKSNDKYYSVSENNLKDPIKKIQVWDNIDFKNSNIYISGNFDIIMPNYLIESQNLNNLYKPNYSISLMTLNNLLNQPENFILACRYYGNYFKIQNSGYDKEVKVFCEDFITTIVSRYSKINDSVFYTGLKNGKLIKWEIKLLPIENPISKKNLKVFISSFTVNELSHIYDHNSSITAIEINNKKQIIATSCEDKFIHIRKLYDFEILTVIDLTYCYGNSIISENKYIFPSLIKISDLNCIYVLFYDFKNKKTFIRGYTLNGLFFAQTENNDNAAYNNIVISKDGNLIVGDYNINQIYKLNSFDLKIRNIENLDTLPSDNGTIWIEVDYSNNSFIALYKKICKFIPISKQFNL